jgi:uncharacterized repeat protein (TIGR01451 family)
MVSKHGENKWVDNYQAQAGETVDYLVEYKNTGEVQQDNVTLRDKLPAGMTYVNGSSVLGNSKHPNGIKTNDGITTQGLNIGSYAKNATAWVIFSAKVPSKEAIACGKHTLKNVVSVETDYGTKSDDADVTVNGDECKPPVKIKVCELTTKKIVTIDEKDFDSTKHSKNLEDCKEITRKVEVCNPATGKIITVDEKDADKYAPIGSDKCKEMKVCVIKDKTVQIIKKSDFDADIHTTDMSVCKETPEVPETPETPTTPTELPQTGPADMVAKLAAVVSLTASTAYYVASRRQG